MEKKYLMITILTHFLFYILMFLSMILKSESKFWFSHPLTLFYGLFIVAFLGMIIGRKLLKIYPDNKYIRLGFIINITPIILFILYLVIFVGVKPVLL